MLNARLHHAAIPSALLALLTVACGAEQPGTTANVPTMPDTMPGQASLSGRVLDGNGQGVPGAVVKIAETDATTNTDASGAYQLAVPSDSTLTLTAAAAGMANTFRESVVLASGSAVSDFDVLLLPTAELSTINMLGPPGVAAMRGTVAVRLHVMGGSACVAAGAHVTVFPPSAATVVYAAPAASSGGLDMPDPTLQDLQPGTQIVVWLADVVPPGNMNLLRIDVQKAGCQLMPQSPSLGGLTFPGLREVAAASLTEADLFLQ
jgi:hypothetical protein